MARAIARVSGVALKPGISRNNRLYTRDAIARMVARAQERIESGGGLAIKDRTTPEPLSQRTHHAAEDDSTRIVGAIRSLSLDEDGAARFTADIADTDHGRTIASLLDTSDGQPPFLRNVSIRAGWVGDIRTIPGKDGEAITTAPDIDLAGLDYTASPGVPGAQVDHFEWTGTQPAAGESASRTLITESIMEAHVTAITEETPAAEVTPAAPPAETAVRQVIGEASEAFLGDLRGALRAVLPVERTPVLRNGLDVTEAVQESPPLSKRDSGLTGAGRVWADPGYQADKKQRYDLSTKANAKAAWSYINQADNAKAYSAAQLKRVKGRIMKALKSFGVSVSAEGWTIEPAYQVTEAVAEFAGDPSTAGSWCIRACNGPVCIELSSYCMDPADLDVVLRASADAACLALKALDPDMDGDVDVAGAGPNSDTDRDHQQTAPAPAAPAVETATAPEPEPELAPATETDAPVEAVAEAVEETAPQESTDPAPEPAAVTEEKEGTGMSESTTQTAAGTAPAVESTPLTASAIVSGGVHLSDDQFKSLLEALRPAQATPVAEAAPAAPPAPAPAAAAPPAPPVPPAAPALAAPVAEDAAAKARFDAAVDERLRTLLAAQGAPAPVAETDEQRFAKAVEASVTERMQQMVASGEVTPSRAGLTPGGPVDEHRTQAAPGAGDTLNSHGLPSSWPDKPLHQYTSEELSLYTGPVLDHHVMGRQAVTQLR